MKEALGSLLWASCWVNNSHQCQKASSIKPLDHGNRELQNNRGGKDLWSGSDEAAQGHVWLKFEVPGRDILQPLWASTPTSEHPHKEWTFPGISSSGCWHHPPFYASRTVEMFLTVPKEAAGKTSSLLPLSALQLRGKQTGVRSRPDIRKKF